MFKGLDTYKVRRGFILFKRCLTNLQALADANIIPDSSKTYELSAVKKALASLHGGYEPHIGCSNGALSEVWYFFNIRGNAIDGEYEPTKMREFSVSLIVLKGRSANCVKFPRHNAPTLSNIRLRVLRCRSWTGSAKYHASVIVSA